MRHRRVGADDQIEIGDHRGGVGEIIQVARQIAHQRRVRHLGHVADARPGLQRIESDARHGGQRQHLLSDSERLRSLLCCGLPAQTMPTLTRVPSGAGSGVVDAGACR